MFMTTGDVEVAMTDLVTRHGITSHVMLRLVVVDS